MRRNIDSLVFVSRNRTKIEWTAGPSDETHSDTAAAYNENLLKDSDEFDSGNWTNDSILTAGTNQGPYPLHREFAGYTTEDDSITNARRPWQGVTVPNDAVSRIGSIYIEKTTGALTNYPGIWLYYTTGGVGKVVGVVIDTTNGTLTDMVAPRAPDASWIVDAGTHWLVTVQSDNNASGNTKLRFYYLPAYNTDGSGSVHNFAVGSSNIFRAMLAVGSASKEPQRTQALDGTYTNLTLTTGGLTPRAWIGASVTIAGTDYGLVLDNGADWIRVAGDASGEGALAVIVLTAPPKKAYVYINGFQVAESPVDTDTEELEFSVPDAFNIELHELPDSIGAVPDLEPYTIRPFVVWSEVDGAFRYIIYRQYPDETSERFYQMEQGVDDFPLYQVRTVTDLINDGPGWNWFRVEVKTLNSRISARDLWAFFVKALPDQPSNAEASGTSPNISITLTT